MDEKELEMQQAESQQEEPKKGRRDTFLDGLKQRRTDAGAEDIDWEDSEARYGAIEDEYNANQDELNKHRENNDKLNKMFAENPQSAYWMNDLVEGKGMISSLVRRFGDVFTAAHNDPSEENIQALEEAETEWNNNADTIRQNLEASEAAREQWKKDNNISEEDAQAVFDLIDAESKNILDGKTTGDLLSLVHKGIMFDKAVADAKNEGLRDGRGEQINEKLRTATNGDGMPMAAGSGNADALPQQDGFLKSAGKKDAWADAVRKKY